MKIRWWWILFLIPIVVGLARLRFDTEVLDLLPPDLPAVQGLKIFQQQFSDARELIVTVKASDPDAAETIAGAIFKKLAEQTNLVLDVTARPPWQEHPDQMAELIAYLWLNQPPDEFRKLAERLSQTNLPSVLAATRDRLSTSMSPDEIGRAGYDPLGLTQLPGAMNFSQGQNLFSSDDGTFRLIFVRAKGDLADYRECIDWLTAIKASVKSALPPGSTATIGYTGRPVFVAEISSGMKHDIHFSVAGTSVIIAILFWLAHRRIKPMLWLLTLLALILGTTLAFGGLIFGTINVMSMGFAAILLGLAVDYAVVHYQEAISHPDLSIPEVRRAIAPAIFWAAVTTISAFLVLNFGGLPGLAQLGTFVGIGVALAAVMMIFAYLPPLFPERMRPIERSSAAADVSKEGTGGSAGSRTVVFIVTVLAVIGSVGVLSTGLPKMDASGAALQPCDSEAYGTMNAIKTNLNQRHEPLWLVVAGRDEGDVARRFDAIEPVLASAVSNGVLSGFDSPRAILARPAFQSDNRAAASAILAEREAIRAAILSNGFAEQSLGLTEGVLHAWQQAIATTNLYQPTNPLCEWIFRKATAPGVDRFYAAAFLYPAAGGSGSVAALEARLPHDETWLSGWGLLGQTILAKVENNLWKLLLPMVGLVLLSLWLAFRRGVEIVCSLGILAMSGLCVLAVMRVCGWQWNLLNLMSLPLILGTGVDYSIFMQLALRRYQGDLRMAYRSVGRALLLCGGTAVAGFGSLGFSSNAGMAGLGRVCAVGILCNMLISVFLLPVWWRVFSSRFTVYSSRSPSRLYAANVWRAGLFMARLLPKSIFYAIARIGASIYWWIAPDRRGIVVNNLLPIAGDRAAARALARRLYAQFGLKLCDLLRFEAGITESKWFSGWKGWEHFNAAQARGKGVLLVTPHLGNWEFGGAFLVEHGHRLLVLTQPEPDERLTELRQRSRARYGVETLVVGDNDAFAAVEIIKRLQAGAIVALLVDRPPAHTAVTVKLFGKDFPASIAVAELARASGCAILPCSIVRDDGSYRAEILPEIVYDRLAIGRREGRIALTQQILGAFEPVIRENAAQWYHFVPVWPRGGE